jgi:hypothetical protein
LSVTSLRDASTSQTFYKILEKTGMRMTVRFKESVLRHTIIGESSCCTRSSDWIARSMSETRRSVASSIILFEPSVEVTVSKEAIIPYLKGPSWPPMTGGGDIKGNVPLIENSVLKIVCQYLTKLTKTTTTFGGGRKV